MLVVIVLWPGFLTSDQSVAQKSVCTCLYVLGGGCVCVTFACMGVCGVRV